MTFKDLELSKKEKNPNQRATPMLPAAINSLLGSRTMTRLVITGDISKKMLELLASPTKNLTEEISKAPYTLSKEEEKKKEEEVNEGPETPNKTKRKDDEIDWRSLYRRIIPCNDPDEDIEQAKGKAIKRPKDEARSICFQFINHFTESNPDKHRIR